ncbi:diacylglycerol/lipid kinase family protein [Filimonas effusa]|uniref:Diacylglycerol kinase family lipid kinase n=1 Tax=Filimonas effusa TaxID=2508721 RepID=A0A4V1MAJ8_9BACT|nr:diacylglycerol kinase family protein [Filimonas effusa]RXK86126.1 diacylglycerol kinase family lipid kinase [Filimonas effusa]
MRLLFVINSKAGRRQKDWQSIVDNWLISNRMGDSHYFHIQENVPNCHQLLAVKIKECAPDRVIAIGGDGTLKLVAGLLIDSHISMGIIPGGSANGMAAELNIPQDETTALEIAVKGKSHAIDLIKINEEWCIHLSDMGLNASLLRHFEQIPQRGMLGYLRAFWRLLLDRKYPRLNLHLITDGVHLRRHAIMAVIANATRYGTGAVINPDGRINDGWMELVIIRRLAIAELFKMMVTRKPFNRYNIEIIRCRQLDMKARPASPFQVDGEYLGTADHVKAAIYPAALQIVSQLG